MKRIALAGLGLALLLPGTALARPATKHEVIRYERAYAHVKHVFGARTAGRNIDRWGMPDGKPATAAQILTSTDVLHRMFAPPPTPAPAVPAAAPQPVATAAVASAPASSGGGLPACASESGTNYSTGPANTNQSSGATGRYQILPSTAAGYGCNLGTPAGQDACAQTIYAHQGSSAWVGCGG